MDIRIENLTVDFVYPKRVIPAVCNASVTIRDGRITGIIGESGSGKSVLAMALLRLLPVNARVQGSCRYGETELLSLRGKNLEALRRSQLALIPQNPYESLNPSFTIRHIFRNAMTSLPGTRHEKSEKVKKILRELGFTDPESVLSRYSFELSGGMNQRVLAALALVREPQWIIADEPTKGLDAVLRDEVQELFAQIARSVGSVLMITHDLYLAKALCDDLIVMYNGEIIEQGACAQVLGAPKHPYTRGLIGSLPEKGMVPIPAIHEKVMDADSCRFYPRCTQACARCREEKPDLYSTGEGKARCFLYD